MTGGYRGEEDWWCWLVESGCVGWAAVVDVHAEHEVYIVDFDQLQTAVSLVRWKEF